MLELLDTWRWAESGVTNERDQEEDSRHARQREGEGRQHDFMGCCAVTVALHSHPLMVRVQRAQQQGKTADDPQGECHGTHELERRGTLAL